MGEGCRIEAPRLGVGLIIKSVEEVLLLRVAEVSVNRVKQETVTAVASRSLHLQARRLELCTSSTKLLDRSDKSSYRDGRRQERDHFGPSERGLPPDQRGQHWLHTVTL